jgi:hypothetical protein
MPADTAQLPDRSASNGRALPAGYYAGHSVSAGTTAKLQLLTIDALDGRTLSARRARDLAASFEAEIGGTITAMRRREIARAAMLCAVAEDLQVRRLRGEPVSVNDLVRVDGAATRAVRALSVKPAEADKRMTHADVVAAILAGRTAPAPGDAQDASNAAGGTQTALEAKTRPAHDANASEGMP